MSQDACRWGQARLLVLVLVLAACGPRATDPLACSHDSECHLDDPSCGGCGCPTVLRNTEGVRAHDAECAGIEVRCAQRACPEPTHRPVCESGRCVAVPLAPAPIGPPTL